MGLEVKATVGGLTVQTGLEGRLLPPSADMAGHDSSSNIAVINKRLESSLLQILYQSWQHVVLLQVRSYCENLPTPRTAVDSVELQVVPVSTGSGHWILEKIQTQATRKGFRVQLSC